MYGRYSQTADPAKVDQRFRLELAPNVTVSQSEFHPEAVVNP